MTSDEIMTVTGTLPANEMGFTLAHEHLFINLMPEFRGTGLLNDTEVSKHELMSFKSAGGSTIIDPTNEGLMRRPEALQALSRETGVHIVMGCGLYRDPYIDKARVDEWSVDELAERIVSDLEFGVGDSGVRAGIIGEIGCDKWFISAVEERSFRAAARAHHRTGVTITTHAARWPVGTVQLDLLESEGVDPRRVIIGHCDLVPDIGYHETIARRGAYVAFDNIRGDSDHETRQRVRYIRNLRDLGYLNQILLSHDVCLKSLLETYGGCGFTYIPTVFLSLLREEGFSDDEIDTMMITNPREALVGSRG